MYILHKIHCVYDTSLFGCHADKYHSTVTPNKCTKCKECEYFRPRENNTSHSNKPIDVKFDGICRVCELKIIAGEHQIIRNSKNIWIHNSCDDSI